MTIVAFLQNMWVRDAAQIRSMINRDTTGRLRERLVRYSLFAGCLTGRRLKAAFGELCDEIVWEEASPVIDDNAKRYHPPVEAHIRAVLAKHQPGIVLCLTKRGEPALKAIVEAASTALRPIRFIPSIHPAARGPGAVLQLAAAAVKVQRLVQRLAP